MAQSDSLEFDLRIGIGATIEKEYEVTINKYSAPSVGIKKVYIPIFYKSKIKVVPEFGYWDYKVKLNDETSKANKAAEIKASFSSLEISYPILPRK